MAASTRSRSGPGSPAIIAMEPNTLYESVDGNGVAGRPLPPAPVDEGDLGKKEMRTDRIIDCIREGYAAKKACFVLILVFVGVVFGGVEIGMTAQMMDTIKWPSNYSLDAVAVAAAASAIVNGGDEKARQNSNFDMQKAGKIMSQLFEGLGWNKITTASPTTTTETPTTSLPPQPTEAEAHL